MAGGFGADMAGQGCSIQAKLHPSTVKVSSEIWQQEATHICSSTGPIYDYLCISPG